MRRALASLLAACCACTAVSARAQRPPPAPDALTTALAACPDVASEVIWPPPNVRVAVHEADGHVIGAERGPGLFGRVVIDLERAHCRAVVLQVEDPVSDASSAYPVTARAIGGGSVDAARVAALATELDAGVVVGRIDASCAAATSTCATGELGLARLLAQAPDEDVRELHGMPDWGLWPPNERVQPWHDGGPRAAQTTFWPRAALESLGVSVLEGAAGIVVPASGALRPLGAASGAIRWSTSHVSAPRAGDAIVAYDATRRVHRWVGFVEGATRLGAPRALPLADTTPPRALWLGDGATVEQGGARRAIVYTLDPWSGIVMLVGPGDARLAEGTVVLPSIHRRLQLSVVVGQAAVMGGGAFSP